TSTIPIHRIAEAASRPEQVVGMHFFSPVARMPLLEVIPSARTAAQVISTAVGFGRRMGKTAIVVKDSPGFWINRILTPYMNEAGHLLVEGVAIEEVDRLMVEFGFPVGPITLLDEVGMDVGEKVVGVLRLNEAARAVGEGIVRTPRDGDVGAIFGFGFPPFRGGPLRHADDLGAARIVGELERLAERYGARFAPSDVLRDQAQRNAKFYP